VQQEKSLGEGSRSLDTALLLATELGVSFGLNLDGLNRSLFAFLILPVPFLILRPTVLIRLECLARRPWYAPAMANDDICSRPPQLHYRNRQLTGIMCKELALNASDVLL